MSDDIPVGLCQCGCGRRTAIAKETNRYHGYVKGQPKKYVPGHRALFRPGHRITDRDYTIQDRGYITACWIWNWPAMTGAGYARVMLNRRTLLAHRAMYEQEVGPIPEGLTIDHLCNVKPCVNPSHLEAVTFQENIRRRDILLRAKKAIS